MGSRHHAWIDLLDGPLAGTSQVTTRLPAIGDLFTTAWQGAAVPERHEYRVTARDGKRWRAVHVRSLGPVETGVAPAPEWDPYGRAAGPLQQSPG